MENAVEIVNLGKMYRLFDKQSDRIQDIFGLDKLRRGTVSSGRCATSI